MSQQVNASAMFALIVAILSYLYALQLILMSLEEDSDVHMGLSSSLKQQKGSRSSGVTTKPVRKRKILRERKEEMSRTCRRRNIPIVRIYMKSKHMKETFSVGSLIDIFKIQKDTLEYLHSLFYNFCPIPWLNCTVFPTEPLEDYDSGENVYNLSNQRGVSGRFYSGLNATENFISLVYSRTSSGYTSVDFSQDVLNTSLLAISGRNIDHPFLPSSYSHGSDGYGTGDVSLHISRSIQSDIDNTDHNDSNTENSDGQRQQVSDNRYANYPAADALGSLEEIQAENMMDEGAVGGIPLNSSNEAVHVRSLGVETENCQNKGKVLNLNKKSITEMKLPVCGRLVTSTEDCSPNNLTCPASSSGQGQYENGSSSRDGGAPHCNREPVMPANNNTPNIDEAQILLDDENQNITPQIQSDNNQPLEQAVGVDTQSHGNGNHYGSFNRLHKDPESTVIVVEDPVPQQTTVSHEPQTSVREEVSDEVLFGTGDSQQSDQAEVGRNGGQGTENFDGRQTTKNCDGENQQE